MEKTIKCPICSQPYKFYNFYAVDQSACPSCVAKAKNNMRKTISKTGTNNFKYHNIICSAASIF